MSQPKILIADDEPNILMLASVMFQDMGFDVVSASDGEEAVEKAKAESPDLVITDIVMPKKDGFSVCREIRNTSSIANIPIIILSAMGDEYNKISGFDVGADDYVTKPFNVEELKARVNALLLRYRSKTAPATPPALEPQETPTDIGFSEVDCIPTGISSLDTSLGGGLPKGSNILIKAPLGRGKSSFSRQFLQTGLRQNDRCLMVAIDDSPQLVRRMVDSGLPKTTVEYENMDLLRFVDAYSWSSLTPSEERFAVSGMLDLNQLSGVISDAGYELGQTVQNKLGGRRVIDSISSLLVNFDLGAVQRFLSQIARTSHAFGGVTTLFILEEGTVTEQVQNNITYIMDGVLEFAEVDGRRAVRVNSMKWISYSKEWHFFEAG